MEEEAVKEAPSQFENREGSARGWVLRQGIS